MVDVFKPPFVFLARNDRIHRIRYFLLAVGDSGNGQRASHVLPGSGPKDRQTNLVVKSAGRPQPARRRRYAIEYLRL